MCDLIPKMWNLHIMKAFLYSLATMRLPSARIISPFSTRVFKIQVTFVGALSASSTTRTWPNFTALTFKDRTFIINKQNGSKCFKIFITHCSGFIIAASFILIYGYTTTKKVCSRAGNKLMDLHQKLHIVTALLTLQESL